MLRLLAGLSLMSSTIAFSQPVQPPAPVTPVTPVAPVAPVTPETAETPVTSTAPETAAAPEAVDATETAEVEAPKMKKICRTQEVVGSAIPRRICTMRAIKPAKPRS